MRLGPVQLLNVARASAHVATPARLRSWEPDLAADVCLRALEREAHGAPFERGAFRHMAFDAVRRLAYLLAGDERWRDVWPTYAPAQAELLPIALWRLQAIWSELTPLQREALLEVATGTRNDERHPNSRLHARAALLGKLNQNPRTVVVRGAAQLAKRRGRTS